MKVKQAIWKANIQIEGSTIVAILKTYWWEKVSSYIQSHHNNQQVNNKHSHQRRRLDNTTLSTNKTKRDITKTDEYHQQLLCIILIVPQFTSWLSQGLRCDIILKCFLFKQILAYFSKVYFSIIFIYISSRLVGMLTNSKFKFKILLKGPYVST